MLSDVQLFHVHELRPPTVFVRFARLRSSVTIALKATYELLELLFLAKADKRSWLKALICDLEWMSRISADYLFTPESWFALCTADPSAARRTIRKACESKEGRHLAIREIRPSIISYGAHTCHCGKVCKSIGGLATHKLLAHGDKAVTAWYADAAGLCKCCGTKFDNREHLMAHLSRDHAIAS